MKVFGDLWATICQKHVHDKQDHTHVYTTLTLRRRA